MADEAGLRLVDLAHAFVLAHPAVTSAILGPRTLEQLEDVLAGADVRLDDDVLDRIDAVVPPGTTLNPFDARLRAARRSADARAPPPLTGLSGAWPAARPSPPAASRRCHARPASASNTTRWALLTVLSLTS